MAARKSNNYKALKEAFVSNHNGGSIWEINAVTLTFSVGLPRC
jgi:phosphatidylinositol glycan class W